MPWSMEHAKLYNSGTQMLIQTLKTFSFFRELFSDVSPHEHSLQIHPEILNYQPTFYYLS